MKNIFRNISLIIVILLIFDCSVNAQSWKSRRYEFFYGGGIVNFNGDIGAVSSDAFANGLVWVKFFQTISPTTNIGMRYKINSMHSVTTTLFLGQLYATDHSKKGWAPQRAETFNSFYSEFGARYELNVLKEKRKRTVYRQFGENPLKNLNLPTYLYVGVAGLYNTGKFSSPKNENYSNKYSNFAPVVYGGIGSKYRISRKSFIGAELKINLAINDKVDYAWQDKEGSGAAYGKWYDSYHSFTINYIHQIRSNRNGLPNFRRRGASSNSKSGAKGPAKYKLR